MNGLADGTVQVHFMDSYAGKRLRSNSPTYLWGKFNLSVPDSLIFVGFRLREIGAFRPFRIDCPRLRQAETSVKTHVLSQFKNQKPEFFYDKIETFLFNEFFAAF